MDDGLRLKLDDVELVGRLSSQDRSAFEILFYRHAPAVLGFAKQVLSDNALAEDVVQAVFLRLWRHPERFDAKRGLLRNFLLLDGRARAVDLIRSREARRQREILHLSQADGYAPDAVMVVTRNDERRHIRAAVRDLGEGERTAIELAYFKGLTYRQVATALGLPEGTVKSRIRSGLRRLAPVLATEESTS